MDPALPDRGLGGNVARSSETYLETASREGGNGRPRRSVVRDHWASLGLPSNPQVQPFTGGLCQIKFGDHLACFELGWARGGGSTTRVKEANWLTASISFDPLGTEASSVKRAFAEARQLKGAIIDAPQSLSQKSKQILTELGWRHGPLHNAIVQTDHLGSLLCPKEKHMALWGRGQSGGAGEMLESG